MGRMACGLIMMLGLARLALGLWLGFRPFDDTYITFRYALNLASGYGLVYNVGERVLGTTAPLWALVLATVRVAHAPMELGAIVLSLALDVASALLLFRLLLRLEYSVSTGLAAAVLFLTFFDYFSLARSGMETSCFVFLTVAVLESACSHRFTAAATCCALACLARPEGAVLVVVLMLALWRARTMLRLREVMVCLAPLFLVLGGWAAYALGAYGSIVPQSVMAKAASSGDPGLRLFSWENLALFFLKGQYGGEIFTRTYVQMMPAITLLSAAAAAGLLLALVRGRSDKAVIRALALLLFPVCFVAGLALSGAFTFFPWYYGPIYPFAAALAMVGASTLSQGNVRVSGAVCTLLVCAQIASAVLVKLPGDRTFWVEGYSEVAEVVPRDFRLRVAAPEIGTVGWKVWPATVLDLAGLVTPDAVGVPADLYIRSAKPDYLIVRTDNAADLLARVAGQHWFTAGYELAAVRRDPHAEREFRAYRRLSRAAFSGR